MVNLRFVNEKDRHCGHIRFVLLFILTLYFTKCFVLCANSSINLQLLVRMSSQNIFHAMWHYKSCIYNLFCPSEKWFCGIMQNHFYIRHYKREKMKKRWKIGRTNFPSQYHCTYNLFSDQENDSAESCRRIFILKIRKGR